MSRFFYSLVMPHKMPVTTVGELLYWSYANLAMAHAAVTKHAESYGRVHFMIRARLYAGLKNGTMTLGPLAEDERLKMVLPQACCYCGEGQTLSVDHLIPTKRGGANTGDNFVWACRSCNSSKGAQDALLWLKARNEFPPLLLLRRYLKLAIDMAKEMNVMNTQIQEAPILPFELPSIPQIFPRPPALRMWVVSVA